MRRILRHERRERVAHMVGAGSYVLRQGATLVFRRRVPKTAAKNYRKTFFTISPRMHLISEARLRGAIATRFTDDLIGLIEACGADMLGERDIEAAVDDAMRF